MSKLQFKVVPKPFDGPNATLCYVCDHYFVEDSWVAAVYTDEACISSLGNLCKDCLFDEAEGLQGILYDRARQLWIKSELLGAQAEEYHFLAEADFNLPTVEEWDARIAEAKTTKEVTE